MAKISKGLESLLPFKWLQNVRLIYDVAGGIYLRGRYSRRKPDISANKLNLFFLVGCGRSGTTILGNTLGKHAEVCYLNEPQHIWFALSNKADIWSPLAGFFNGKIKFTSSDASQSQRELFYTIVSNHVRPKSNTVVEKWPINSMRIDYLATLFPEAKFIVINRDPLEVANSIEQCCVVDGTWWGWNSYKWKELVKFAKSLAVENKFDCHTESDFTKGLIEWVINKLESSKSLKQIHDSRIISVDYGSFVKSPIAELNKLINFMGLKPCGVMNDFASNNVKVKPQQEEQKRARKQQLSDNDLKILAVSN